MAPRAPPAALVFAPEASASDEARARDLLTQVRADVADELRVASASVRADVDDFLHADTALRYLRARRFHPRKSRAMLARSVRYVRDVGLI